MPVAITREISPAIVHCELTHLARVPIDLGRARAEHHALERCLESLGCTVVRLETSPDLPDSVFVEDIAVVFDELAVVTRPGAVSRRAETPAVADAVAAHRPVRRIEAPGTVDGGDVLVVGRRVYVGETGRTNAAGIEQMRGILAPLGYDVAAVPVRGCLHLKSGVTAVADGALVINRDFVPAASFAGFDLIDVDPAEPLAANALRLGETIVYQAEHPRTRARLEAHGLDVRTVPAGELAKAEGGVTCCAIVVRDA